jgi:hypothetical protein
LEPPGPNTTPGPSRCLTSRPEILLLLPPLGYRGLREYQAVERAQNLRANCFKCRLTFKTFVGIVLWLH